MEKMMRTDFEVKTNPQTQQLYVIKVKDELTKNHRDIENIVSGVMPANIDDPLCPVKSFQKYISHLNPENKFMWQKPLDHIDFNTKDIWYGKQHVGKNPLRTFMSDVSDKCKLSQIYTNHSIRVTGCTVLNRHNFSAAEIMAVSGHKSVQSLAIYQKTQHKQKEKMGNVLFQSMIKPEDEIIVQEKPKQLPAPTRQEALPAPPQQQAMASSSERALVPVVQNKENMKCDLIPFEANFNDDDGVSDIDLLSALCGLENNVTVANTSTVVTNTIPRAMFANCQIGTINFTINKQEAQRLYAELLLFLICILDV